MRDLKPWEVSLMSSLPSPYTSRSSKSSSTISWGNCPKCKQSFTGSYMGVPKCVRCWSKEERETRRRGETLPVRY